MRVALVTIPQSREGESRRGKTPGTLPPLGLATLASLLQREGHKVIILDSCAWGLGYVGIVNALKEFSPHLVGLSFTSPQRHLAYGLAAILKENFPSATIVGGGSHATTFPEETLASCPQIDLLLVGECDLTFPKAIRALEDGKQPFHIGGTVFKGVDGIIAVPPARQDFDLNSLPYPSRHLLPLGLYMPEPTESKSSPSTTIIVSRGCSYAHCGFCLRSGPLRRVYRVQAVKRTIAEIEMLQRKHSISEIQFYDDDIFSHKEWIEEFSSELIQRGISLSWFARGRPGTIARGTLELAREAGLYGLEIGFESGNQVSLDLIRKDVTVEQSLAVGKWTRKLGIEVTGSFILGLPGETAEMGRKTVSFAKKVDPTFAVFIPYHPEPGTPLYEFALKGGTLVRSPYGAESYRSRFIPAVSYVPSGYKDAEQLAALIRRAYLGFYLRPSKMLSYLMMARQRSQSGRFLRGLSYFVRVVR